MSMEQAILELAGGMKELAAAMREMAGRPIEVSTGFVEVQGYPGVVVSADTELEAAVTKVEKDAKAETKKSVGAAAEETAASAAPVKVTDTSFAEPELLSYTADVKPVLLQVNKAKGREALAGLLKKYGAATGDKLTAESLPGILADAQALLAA